MAAFLPATHELKLPAPNSQPLDHDPEVNIENLTLITIISTGFVEYLKVHS